MKLFYRVLRSLFRHSPAAAGFWAGMYDDEAEHLRELHLIHDDLPPDVLAVPADPVAFKKAWRNSSLPIRSYLKSIKTLEDAYRFSHQLENSEIMTVFEFIREKYIPLTRRRSFTLSVLEDHLKKIMDFPSRFGEAEERMKVPAVLRWPSFQ